MDNKLWRYFPKEFDGRPIMFRQSMINGEIQLRIDDQMAISNGYASREDLQSRMRIYYGRPDFILPDWLTVSNETELQMFCN